MQKHTKDLFLKLKALRPSVNSIEHYYGIDWKSDRLVEYWYIQYNSKHFTFNSEKDLCTKIKELIVSTQSDLGFKYPLTAAEFKLK